MILGGVWALNANIYIAAHQLDIFTAISGLFGVIFMIVGFVIPNHS